MATTELSITATPGKPHSFSPKDPSTSGPHTGIFTELSVTATPGKIHSFSAKDPEGGGAHTGLFTELSVMATPGKIHSFTAKEAAPIPESILVAELPQGGHPRRSRRKLEYITIQADDRVQIDREDAELLEFLVSISDLL